MCGQNGNGDSCEGCSGMQIDPALMKRMVAALGVDGMLQGEAREAAAAACNACTDDAECADWLAVAEIRGADHAPGFCRNGETFDALASEAPTTL